MSPQTPATTSTLQDSAWAAVRQMFTLLILGGILVFALPKLIANPAAQLQMGVGRSLLWGALSFVGIIAIMLVLLIVCILAAIGLAIVGLGSLAALSIMALVVGEALLFVGIMVAIIFLAPLAVAVGGGRFLLGKLSPSAAATRLLPLMLGIVFLVGAESVPVLGGFIRLLVVLFGLGALALGLFQGSGKPPRAPKEHHDESWKRTRHLSPNG